MQATVVLNLHSNKTRHYAEELPRLLAERGIQTSEMHLLEGSGGVTKTVKNALKKGATHVIVGGGDGTMAQAVNALAHTETILGVLPLGTGNSFALTLGIGDDIEKALDIIAAERIVSVDLGVVNEKFFANFATIGLPAEIAASTDRTLKTFVGPLAYALGGIKPFLQHRPFKAKIKADDDDLKLKTQQMVVASGRFFGKQPLTPEANIIDGRLAFFTTSGVSHLEIARTYVAMAMGLAGWLPDAHRFSAKKITIKTKPKQPLSIDGNAYGTTPARFSIARRALRVSVAPTFDDAS
jgi:diacylglycerol kinase (ATP)